MSPIPHASRSAEVLLSVDQVEVFYEQSILALRGISLQVRQGQMVALLGANGAGKKHDPQGDFQSGTCRAW